MRKFVEEIVRNAEKVVEDLRGAGYSDGRRTSSLPYERAGYWTRRDVPLRGNHEHRPNRARQHSRRLHG